MSIKYWPSIKKFPQRVFSESFKLKKIDVNQASADDFINLPGIGPAIAERIIQYRIKHGKFHNLEELKNIYGISDKKFKKLKRHLSID